MVPFTLLERPSQRSVSLGFRRLRPRRIHAASPTSPTTTESNPSSPLTTPTHRPAPCTTQSLKSKVDFTGLRKYHPKLLPVKFPTTHCLSDCLGVSFTPPVPPLLTSSGVPSPAAEPGPTYATLPLWTLRSKTRLSPRQSRLLPSLHSVVSFLRSGGVLDRPSNLLGDYSTPRNLHLNDTPHPPTVIEAPLKGSSGCTDLDMSYVTPSHRRSSPSPTLNLLSHSTTHRHRNPPTVSCKMNLS